MASLTMTASSFGSNSRVAAITFKQVPKTTPKRVVMAKASNGPEPETERMKNTAGGRRDVMFAVAAAAACSLAGVAMAEEEPKKGTPEAKKKYGPVCVTMPTARICHK